MDINKTYQEWVEKARLDEDLKTELLEMEHDNNKLEDCFYRHLAFGTGGLRGIIGAGTNRMNVYTVGRATLGLANYLLKLEVKNPSVAISYDSRIKSFEFAKMASRILSQKGIHVYIYKELMPTPCLSYAVRYHHANLGIMITASHNPKEYNGYKVYDHNGCQITDDMAHAIEDEINQLSYFELPSLKNFEENLSEGNIEYISEATYDSYTEQVLKQSIHPKEEVDLDIAIVYSPLNGTGLKPITRVLKEYGFHNLYYVEEQMNPDGSFTTCPYPNPENKDTFNLAFKKAKEVNADLIMLSDPDADRCGVAVKDKEDYRILTGNEVGLLLLDYILKGKEIPNDACIIKTIVTSNLAEIMASKHNVKTINVLTGFKYIGEQIGFLEQEGKEDTYLFGFEESDGYLSGTYVRDKDAPNACLLIAEMCAYYQKHNSSLLKQLDLIYQTYGYNHNALYSFPFEGQQGFQKMNEIMHTIKEMDYIGEYNILNKLDYSQGIDGLPKSNVVKLVMDGGTSVIVRPSGTEPKIKIYLSIQAKDKENALLIEEELMGYLKELMKG